MSFFERFSKTIIKFVPPSALSQADVERLEALDPDKFYVENVRSILGISTWQARVICESGVRQRLFDRGVEVRCPDGSVAAQAENESELPETVECYVEHEGHLEVEELPTHNMKRNTFYRLHAE